MNDEPGIEPALNRIMSALSNASLSDAEIRTEAGRVLLEHIVLGLATGEHSPLTLRSHLRMALVQRSTGPHYEEPIPD